MKRVASVPSAALRRNGKLRVPFPPYDILLVDADGALHAIEDACNHAGASLAEGPLCALNEPDGQGGFRKTATKCGVICPMHGYVFDLRDGRLRKPKGLCDDQRTFIARREGDEIVLYDPFEVTIG